MLDARALHVRVGPLALLDDVSIQARAGEITAILGPNGAGKSTLFHALAGGIRPSAGEVRLFDRSIDAWPVHALARTRAVLTQHASLTFDFPVLDAVALGRIPHPRDPARDASIALEALSAVGLRDFAQRGVLSLSGGEKQRVHLARTLAQIWDTDPHRRCVMLDEPTVHLDFAQKRIAMDALAGIARGGAVVLVILHELNLAARYADRLVLMARGRVVADGAAHAVLTPEQLGAAYGDAPRIGVHPDDGRPVVL